MTKIWPVFAAFALCIGNFVTKATAAADEKEGPFFTVLAVGEESLPEDLHWLETPDKGMALQTSPVHRSVHVPAVVGKDMIFGVPRPNPAKGESLFVPLCTVPWPTGATERVLVLLMAERSGIKGVAIDDAERIFPRGTLRIVNLVKRPLAARWGDATWEVPIGPAPSKPYPLVQSGPDGQPGRFKVMLGVRWKDGGDANIIYAGRAEARADSRTLLVVREVQETAITATGQVLDVGVSYNTRWVVERLPEVDAD